MKIIFLSDDFPPESFGGAGISTYELAREMKSLGHDVGVVTTSRRESGVAEYEGLMVYRIYSNYREKWRAYKSLYNSEVIKELKLILEETKPDVVHAHNIHFYISFYALKLAGRYAKAVIFTARDTMTVYPGKLATSRYLRSLDSKVSWFDELNLLRKRWNPFRKALIRHYLKSADGIVAISKSLADALQKNGIKDVQVIYNGLDLSEWGVSNEEVESFKIKHNLKDKKVVLCMGRLSGLKGGERAIAAMTEIVQGVPNATLLVASRDDEYTEEMRAYARKFGVEDHIQFTGWIERHEVKTAYAAADVVLMPSIYLDAFGRVNIEAMAAEKPVVGTRFGGTPEIVVDGETGYIVDPNNTKEVADRCIRLLQNEDLARRFGVSGRKRLEEKFNLRDKAKEYINLYESCMKKAS